MTSNIFQIAHMLKFVDNFLHILTMTDPVWYEMIQTDLILKVACFTRINSSLEFYTNW
jgi:hypothetical protein